MTKRKLDAILRNGRKVKQLRLDLIFKEKEVRKVK